MVIECLISDVGVEWDINSRQENLGYSVLQEFVSCGEPYSLDRSVYHFDV